MGAKYPTDGCTASFDDVPHARRPLDMYLIEIFLPLCDNNGARFPNDRYTEVHNALGNYTVELSPASHGNTQQKRD
jgi:hypothetical protein